MPPKHRTRDLERSKRSSDSSGVSDMMQNQILPDSVLQLKLTFFFVFLSFKAMARDARMNDGSSSGSSSQQPQGKSKDK